MTPSSTIMAARSVQRAVYSSLTLLLLLSISASSAAAHNFPYVPTQILMPSSCFEPAAAACDGHDIAYIFHQSDDGVDFKALNFSTNIDLDFKLDTLSQTLPFLDDKPDTTAFGATRTANGTLLVYAGQCDGDRGDAWSYTQGGQWEKRRMADDGEGPRGPYFLGGSMAFSSTLAPTMDQPTIYTYGGMCTTPETNADSWQSSGNYTKSMLSLAPTSEQIDTGYTLSVASNSGPRTPIAGFTLTPLTPSMTNKSGIVTQQASYVLLGGHTQQAFINMSTAAVWNLPAESWTYVAIQGPDAMAKTELAVKGLSSRATTSDTVYSRSGHTAVLSEDGQSVIVLGGWVGDIDTPAEPQLAILEMSEAYSSWQWQIPDAQPDTDGIYGHGAALLPGNVMIVYGGWEISSSASRMKRQVSSASSPRFLNLTSMSWTSSYSNPNAGRPSPGTPNAPNEDGKPDSKSLGLGLGLGLGLAVLIIVSIFVFLCWRKKTRRERDHRDQAVRALSQDASHFFPDHHGEMMERDEPDPWGPSGWYTGGQDPYQNGERSLGYETMRGGSGEPSHGSLPGLHIPRKPVTRQQRVGYVPTATRPASFVSVPGRIHPIYEDEEEESYHHNQHNEVLTPTSEAPSDPFLTPTHNHAPPPNFPPPPGSRGSSTPSPEGRRHDPEVQDWVSDVDAADAMLARMNSRQGRGSPTRRNSHRSALRDDESRNGSNLSESARSMAESLKAPVRLFAGSTLLGGSSTEHQKPGSSSSSSYNTARSSFGALQAEGPSLLLGRNTAPSPNYDEDEQQPPSSPSKSKPRRGWLGSLRRVFSTSENTTPTSSREDMYQRDHDPSGGDYEPGLVGLRGELLRRKQGRQDWDEGAGGESDWDIERAVEQRLVQVMFTVPRERLRVVNGGDDDGDRDDDLEVPVQPQTAVLVDPESESQISGEGARVKEAELKREAEQREAEQRREAELRREQEEIHRQREFEREEENHAQENDGLIDETHQDTHGHEDPYHAQEQDITTTTIAAEPDHHDQPHRHPHNHHHLHHHRPIHIPPPLEETHDYDDTFLHPDTSPLDPRFSHSDDSVGRRSSGVVLEAQAVPLTRERPRTRVLQMVDSFETLASREGSPERL
ncbi:hypothetical protein G7046_g42 [Stylonectria norvegica]|nr:hypothetical protein G7046_g42 [Stylonectria norvegica]